MARPERPLNHRAGRLVRTIEIGVQLPEQIGNVADPFLLAAFGGQQFRLVVVEAESHPAGVGVIGRGRHAGRPVRGVGHNVTGIAIRRPPADVDHHLFETQRRDVIDERIVFLLGRVPTSLPFARRCESVPLYLGKTRVPLEHLGHVVVEKIAAHAVSGVVEIAGVRAEESGRNLEGLPGRQIRPEVVAIASLQKKTVSTCHRQPS